MMARTCFPGPICLFRLVIVILFFVLTCGSLFSAHHRSYLHTKERFFTQRIDHFANDLGHTFSQRVFINDQHYRAPGPILLYVGGKATLSATDANWPAMVQLARETGGLIAALEHRYYGASQPFHDLPVENLRYLTVSQALEDIHNFIRSNYLAKLLAPAAPTRRRLSQPEVAFSPRASAASGSDLSQASWVLFGASYGGSLAAWARYQFPNVVHSAVAVSAPLDTRQQFDIHGDKRAIQELPCHASIAAAVRYLDDVLVQHPDQVPALLAHFNLTQALPHPLATPELLSYPLAQAMAYQPFPPTTWPSLTAGLYYRSEPVESLPQLCQALQAATFQSPKQVASVYLTWVSQHYASPQHHPKDGRTLLDSEYPMDETILDPALSRPALWQSCTELKHWTTTPAAARGHVHSRFLTPNHFYAKCVQHFPEAHPYLFTTTHFSKITSDVTPSLGRPRHNPFPLDIRHFRIPTIQASQILFVDGERDPWRPLTANAELDVSAVPKNRILIPNEGHAPIFRWQTSAPLAKACSDVGTTIKGWLGFIHPTATTPLHAPSKQPAHHASGYGEPKHAYSSSGFAELLSWESLPSPLTGFAPTPPPLTAVDRPQDSATSASAGESGIGGKPQATTVATAEEYNASASAFPMVSTLLALSSEYTAALPSSLAAIFPDVPPVTPLRRNHTVAQSQQQQAHDRHQQPRRRWPYPAADSFATEDGKPLSFDSRTIFIFQLSFAILVHLAIEHYSYVTEKV